MTDTELRTAILADATAAALAASGDDAGCAARMASVLPPTLAATYITERGVFAAVADPAAAEAFLQGLEAVARGNPSATPPVPGNPVVARSLAWLAPSNGGIDLAFASVRAMLDTLVAAGVLDAATVATIKALAERPAAVATDDVSRALLPGRANGRIH